MNVKVIKIGHKEDSQTGIIKNVIQIDKVIDVVKFDLGHVLATVLGNRADTILAELNGTVKKGNTIFAESGDGDDKWIVIKMQ